MCSGSDRISSHSASVDVKCKMLELCRTVRALGYLARIFKRGVAFARLVLKLATCSAIPLARPMGVDAAHAVTGVLHEACSDWADSTVATYNMFLGVLSGPVEMYALKSWPAT